MTPSTATAPRPAGPAAPSVHGTATRLRWVDAVRAGALLVVVLGHYLMAVVQVRGDGEASVQGLLDVTTWTHPLTWVLQVMPAFFAVGAVVAAPRWATRELTWSSWRDHTAARVRSLLVPTLPLLALWWLAGPTLVGLFGADLVGHAAQAALVPLWFLATYVLVQATLPALVGVVIRHGVLRPVGVALGAAFVTDVAVRAGVPHVGWANFLFVWSIPTLLGAGHALGRLRTRRLPVVALASVTASLVAVGTGAYAVPLVGAAGQASNTFPPTTLLGLHAVTYSAVILLVGPWMESWLGASARRRAALQTASRLSMPVYLWHMTALVVLVAAAIAAPVPLVDDLLSLPTLTATWWLTRPLFWALGLAVTAALVVLVTRPTAWLLRTSAAAGAPGPAATLVGVLAASVGLAATVLAGTAAPVPLAVGGVGLALVALHPPGAA